MSERQDPLTELGYALPLTTHPRAFILDEMREREWSPTELAERLGSGEGSGRNALGWLLYFSIKPEDARMGPEGAADLARVFGTSAEFWLTLEREWFERVAVAA